MRPRVIFLMYALSGMAAQASYVMRTTDGHIYKNCTLLVAASNAVVIRSDKGEVTIPMDHLVPADRARLEPELKRLRQEAEKVAARNAELSAARKAAADSSQYTEINPPIDLTTGDGRIYRSVSRMIIDGMGEQVTLTSGSGLERIRFDSLSMDWQTKLRPALEKAKTDGADYLWQKRIKDTQVAMDRNRAKRVTATLCGPHKAGVRAFLTSETQDRNVVKVTTEVVISGLPESAKFGSWSGTLLSKEVYSDPKANEIFQVWAVQH